MFGRFSTKKGLVLSLAISALLGSVAVSHAEKYAAFVMDGKTGKVLHAEDADEARFPASVTKVMTLYLLFEELEAGRLKLHSPLHVSAEAAAAPPSKLGLRSGQTITVEEAIRALVTKSANDVAVVVAEGVADDEDEFAKLMTRKARSLGMADTTFKNASGLPDREQMTTARDLVTLGRAIQDRFPKYYKYFSTFSFAYKGRSHSNHNKLLGRVHGVEGIKTGYTKNSGFNLLSSVKRGDRHIIAAVMGGTSGASRDAEMKSLIEENLMKASTGERTLPLVADKKEPKVTVTAKAGRVNIPTPMEQAVVVAQAKITGAPLPQTRSEIKVMQMNKPLPTSKGEWSIQIGAFPQESTAKEALSLAKKFVTGFEPYTENIEKGKAMLVRARFAGFEDKQAAENQCKQLKKQDFACIAVSNN